MITRDDDGNYYSNGELIIIETPEDAKRVVRALSGCGWQGGIGRMRQLPGGQLQPLFAVPRVSQQQAALADGGTQLPAIGITAA